MTKFSVFFELEIPTVAKLFSKGARIIYSCVIEHHLPNNCPLDTVAEALKCGSLQLHYSQLC